MVNKKIYDSPTNGNKCTAAQFLAETMMHRKAKAAKVILPNKFWNLEDYKRDFKGQLFKANTLVKLYDMAAIVRALGTKDGSFMTSLHNPNLIPIIERCQLELKELAESEGVETVDPKDFEQKKTFGKESLRSKLD